MTFKLVEKFRSGGRHGLTPMGISIKNGYVHFGQGILEHFGHYDKVEIYLDKEESEIGFKSTISSITGFKIQQSKTKHGSICSKAIKNLVLSGRFEAKIDKKMVIIKVPEIAEKQK